MKKLLLNTAQAADTAKVPFILTKDDFEGVPILRGTGMITGDVISLWVKVAGLWQDTGKVIDTTTLELLLESLGSYGVTIAMTTPAAVATFTATVTTGALGTLVTTDTGDRYVDGTGFTFTPTGGNNDAVVTYDVVAGSVTNASITTPGTGYTPDGAGFAVLGIQTPTLGVSAELETSGVL